LSDILVIDDDDLLRRFIVVILEKRKYRVQSTETGEAGIKLAAGSVFDLVITDMGLPGVSGLETVKQIRHDSRDIKILAISGSGSRNGGDLDDALRAGADAALAKPFAPMEFLDLVARLVQSSSQG
jgi:CheY-like chemotaxis protein